MGYYTFFNLKLVSPPRKSYLENDIIAELREAVDYAHTALNEDGSGNEACKWYDHENDLCALSRRYPDWRFVLDGDGEDSPDFWIKHFVNGKMQLCQGEVVYPKFDPQKLE